MNVVRSVEHPSLEPARGLGLLAKCRSSPNVGPTALQRDAVVPEPQVGSEYQVTWISGHQHTCSVPRSSRGWSRRCSSCMYRDLRRAVGPPMWSWCQSAERLPYRPIRQEVLCTDGVQVCLVRRSLAPRRRRVKLCSCLPSNECLAPGSSATRPRKGRRPAYTRSSICPASRELVSVSLKDNLRRCAAVLLPASLPVVSRPL